MTPPRPNGAGWFPGGLQAARTLVPPSVLLGFQTLLTGSVILLINLATGVISARLLGAEGRGELLALTVWPQFFAFSVTFGVPSAAVYLISKTPQDADALVTATVLLATILGIVAVLPGILMIPARLDTYSPEVVRFAQWAMIAAPVALLNIALLSVLMARQDFRLYNVGRLMQPVVSLVLMVALVLAGSLTPYSGALVILLSYAPTVLIGLTRVRHCLAYSRRLLGATKSLLSYGSRAWGGDLMANLADQLDRVLILGLVSPIAMGLYVVSSNIAQALRMVSASAIVILFPRASGRSHAEVISLTGRAARVTLAVSLFAAVITLVVSPYLIVLFYGTEFEGAIGVFRILLIEGVVRGVSRVLGQAFMACDRPGALTVLQGLGVGSTAVLILLLVPRYGLYGAGIALLGSTMFQLILTLLGIRFILRQPVPSLWIRIAELRSLVKPSVPAAGETTSTDPRAPDL